MKITKFEVIPTAQVVSMVYLLMGFFIFTPLQLMVMQFKPGNPPMTMNNFLSLFFVIPIFMGFFGFFFSVISCWIYNLVAGKFGGIEIKVE